jgi:hypothetical protein
MSIAPSGNVSFVTPPSHVWRSAPVLLRSHRSETRFANRLDLEPRGRVVFGFIAGRPYSLGRRRKSNSPRGFGSCNRCTTTNSDPQIDANTNLEKSFAASAASIHSLGLLARLGADEALPM